jgi:hypothetical protein
MTGLITKLLAYSRSPRKTFVLLHPIRTAKLGLAYLAGRSLFRRSGGKQTRRHRRRARYAARRAARHSTVGREPGSERSAVAHGLQMGSEAADT